MESAIDRLRAEAAGELGRPVPGAVAGLVASVLGRHPDSVVAILYYGSCLRQGGEPGADAIADLYVLVEGYAKAYRDRLKAAANWALPPNVFYLEVPHGGRVVRAKYAVVSIADFACGCSRRSLHPRLWARFAQPSRLVYARDEATRAAVAGMVAAAVATTVAETAPLLDEGFDAAALWRRAFRESYRAELRPEGGGRAGELYAANAPWYDRVTPLALAALGSVPSGPGARRRAARRWALRRWIGKPMNLLRLIKAAFTFEGGQAYVLWKLRRHSGVGLTPTPWQRRHPLLSAPVLAWRLFRLGAFR